MGGHLPPIVIHPGYFQCRRRTALQVLLPAVPLRAAVPAPGANLPAVTQAPPAIPPPAVVAAAVVNPIYRSSRFHRGNIPPAVPTAAAEERSMSAPAVAAPRRALPPSKE